MASCFLNGELRKSKSQAKKMKDISGKLFSTSVFETTLGHHFKSSFSPIFTTLIRSSVGCFLAVTGSHREVKELFLKIALCFSSTSHPHRTDI